MARPVRNFFTGLGQVHPHKAAVLFVLLALHQLARFHRVMTPLNETEIHTLHEALDGVWIVQTFKQILATS